MKTNRKTIKMPVRYLMNAGAGGAAVRGAFLC